MYETLPPEAQRAIVSKQLVTLLDLVPKDKANKVISAATRLKKRHATIPDLKAKEKEITNLLDELRRDSKRALIDSKSNRDELLDEAIQSLLCWLNDIWRVVYEHNVNFALAHACLIFAAGSLLELGSLPGE